jgi:hypothetical protein
MHRKFPKTPKSFGRQDEGHSSISTNSGIEEELIHCGKPLWENNLKL